MRAFVKIGPSNTNHKRTKIINLVNRETIRGNNEHSHIYRRGLIGVGDLD
jgi:hypothetical protein